MTPDAGSIPRVEIACVPVGDPGNAADPAAWSPWDPACGAVTEVYEIGRYEVTNEEYCAFLNAKATGADPYGLFSSGMQPDPTHPELRGGIIRNGWSGNYTYEVATDFANKPVNHISYWDAVRFVNWLHNGATTGADTEDGAYTITGGGPDWGTIGSRNAGARYFLPTESEWHKAAYYKGGGLDAGYWTYPTCSDSEPTVAAAFSNGDVSNPGPNVVNYLLGADWAMQDGHVTSVGSAGEASAGPYGTFDQGGNVYEWTERHGGGSSSIRGGCWSDGASWLSQSGRGDFSGDVWFPESARFGLRVARRVAEP